MKANLHSKPLEIVGQLGLVEAFFVFVLLFCELLEQVDCVLVLRRYARRVSIVILLGLRSRNRRYR